MMKDYPDTTAHEGRDLSLADVIHELRSHKKTLLWGGVVGILTAIAWTAVEKPTYVSVAVVTTSAASRVAGGLGGIASQLGIGIQGAAQSGTIVPTADLLEELVKSDTLHRRILNDSLLWLDDGSNVGQRIDAGSGDAEPQELASAKSIGSREAILRGTKIRTEKSPSTGSVTIRVSAPNPKAASELNKSLVRQLNQYIIDLGQAQAIEEKGFITSRIRDRERLLAVAEDRMSAFLTQNRSYRESAALAFQYERLNRDVALHHSVLASLQQAIEDASVRAARNTPVLTAFQAPTIPKLPLPRRVLLRVVSGFVAGGIIALLGTLVVSLFRTALAEFERPDMLKSSEH